MANLTSRIYSSVHNTSGKAKKSSFTQKKSNTSKRAFVEKKPTQKPGFWR